MERVGITAIRVDAGRAQTLGACRWKARIGEMNRVGV